MKWERMGLVLSAVVLVAFFVGLGVLTHNTKATFETAQNGIISVTGPDGHLYLQARYGYDQRPVHAAGCPKCVPPH